MVELSGCLWEEPVLQTGEHVWPHIILQNFLLKKICAKQDTVHGREESPENSEIQREERPNPGLPGSNAVLPMDVL